jgi:hypothetical protein
MLQTQKDYLMEYVERIDELLQASLSRESLPIEQRLCTHCSQNNSAKWRCIDCTLAKPVCRRCMRHSHKNSPLHRIECWTGTHFRPAALWEVGTYILVPHHTRVPICSGLSFQIQYLEQFEQSNDSAEQTLLQNNEWAPGPGPGTGPASDHDQENESDNFSHMLDSLDQGVIETDILDGNDEIEVNEADEDIHGFQPYLPDQNMSKVNAMNTTGSAGAGADMGSEPNEKMPMGDALNNTYVRVVHTNGIHHMAMVTCQCRGDHQIPLDLVATNLLPASFIRVRTLFSAQVLDYFRLCNLELKASAYQFYQLIRQLTMPMSPADVVNLYHEFRRMSRLWRWMKKLKWAGYGHTQKNPKDPDPGSLANFCPACPQPNVNLPNDWKDDVNKFVSVNLFSLA